MEAYRQFGHLAADVNPLGKPAKAWWNDRLASAGLDPQATFPTAGIIHGTGKKEMKLSDIEAHLARTYTGKIGFEFADSGRLGTGATPYEIEWLARQIESINAAFAFGDKEADALPDDFPRIAATPGRILSKLVRCEALDHYLAKKFPHIKRYGLEGGEALVPLLDAVFESFGRSDISEAVIGMPHRGRLNILV